MPKRKQQPGQGQQQHDSGAAPAISGPSATDEPPAGKRRRSLRLTPTPQAQQHSGQAAQDLGAAAAAAAAAGRAESDGGSSGPEGSSKPGSNGDDDDEAAAERSGGDSGAAGGSQGGKAGTKLYRGVRPVRAAYRAAVKLKSKSVALGTYQSEEAAARAFDRARIAIAGRKAAAGVLNFPLTDYPGDVQLFGPELTAFLRHVGDRGVAADRAPAVKRPKSAVSEGVVARRKAAMRQAQLAKAQRGLGKGVSQKAAEAAVSELRRADPLWCPTYIETCGICPACRQPWRSDLGGCLRLAAARLARHSEDRIVKFLVADPAARAAYALEQQRYQEGREQRQRERARQQAEYMARLRAQGGKPRACEARSSNPQPGAAEEGGRENAEEEQEEAPPAAGAAATADAAAGVEEEEEEEGATPADSAANASAGAAAQRPSGTAGGGAGGGTPARSSGGSKQPAAARQEQQQEQQQQQEVELELLPPVLLPSRLDWLELPAGRSEAGQQAAKRMQLAAATAMKQQLTLDGSLFAAALQQEQQAGGPAAAVGATAAATAAASAAATAAYTTAYGQQQLGGEQLVDPNSWLSRAAPPRDGLLLSTDPEELVHLAGLCRQAGVEVPLAPELADELLEQAEQQQRVMGLRVQQLAGGGGGGGDWDGVSAAAAAEAWGEEGTGRGGPCVLCGGARHAKRGSQLECPVMQMVLAVPKPPQVCPGCAHLEKPGCKQCLACGSRGLEQCWVRRAPWLDRVAPATRGLMLAAQEFASAAVTDLDLPAAAWRCTPRALLAVGLLAEEAARCHVATRFPAAAVAGGSKGSGGSSQGSGSRQQR